RRPRETGQDRREQIDVERVEGETVKGETVKGEAVKGEAVEGEKERMPLDSVDDIGDDIDGFDDRPPLR
ncbi:MAG TPA: hypothetical protein VM347_24820, partial [Nonomuraea sp.]|nr:hypothetical protein [Nonomuraea sp.]